MSIYEKLFNFQEIVVGVGKDSKNPFYKSKYFDINKLLSVVKPVLNSQKLLLMQPLTNIDGKPAITTIILDIESGEKIENSFVFLDNVDPQKVGSTVTYYRRYSLQSLLGLEALDDDANYASGKNVEEINYKNLCALEYKKKSFEPFREQLLENFEITKPSDLGDDEEKWKEFYEAIQRRLTGYVK